jgi:hypothetical protein
MHNYEYIFILLITDKINDMLASFERYNIPACEECD